MHRRTFLRCWRMLANLAAQETQGLDDTYHVTSYSWEALGSTWKGKSEDLRRHQGEKLLFHILYIMRQENAWKVMEFRMSHEIFYSVMWLICMRVLPVERRLLQHELWYVHPPCNLSVALCCLLVYPLCSTARSCFCLMSIPHSWTGTWSRRGSSVPWWRLNVGVSVNLILGCYYTIRSQWIPKQDLVWQCAKQSWSQWVFSGCEIAHH